jgi:ATP-binding cassette subfamily B protein
VILWGSFRYQRRLEPLYRGVRDQVGRLSGTLANNLGGIATIKAFTAEERETERVGRESEEYRVANREAIRLSSAFVPLIRIAILFGFTMTLLVGGRAVIEGGGRLPRPPAGAVRFGDVRFAYSSGQEVLRGLSSRSSAA